MNNNLIFKLLILIILVGFTLSTLAGTTGKISGIVRDAETNEPLPGCNIVIEGTELGAASNLDGQFIILNIPPGIYTVRASMVGYKNYVINNVRIVADFTTQLEYLMESQILEMDEEVVVTAERELIRKDETSKVAIVSSEEILNMPVQTVQDILTTKAGFTTDADGDLHVRGGRTGELAFMVDGVKLEDPLYGEYSESFNKDAVNEMVIISGTFNAEYGDAMSGIVNIITKDGGDAFHGRIEYTSPMINNSPYRTSNPFSGVEDEAEYVEKSVYDRSDVYIPGTLRASLEGPIVPKLSFFLAGFVNNEDSYLPHGYSLGRDGFGKLTYFVSPTFKLALSGQIARTERQEYSHEWKYLSENQAHKTINTNRQVLMLTHTINSNLFYIVNLSRFENGQKVQVGDKLPSEYEIGKTGETVYFYVEGDDSRYSDNNTVTYRSMVDATFQANNYHQFKTGLELVSHNINVYEEEEPWPSGAQFKDEYTKNPVEFAAYIQDKIEYNYLILNVGLRYDYVDPKATMWPDI
ncbi:MAG: TonB-dependent receptor, partial [Ignavibacteria bacterium]|nr:TonB-dependent receptor [Ignavibacteria bacterium]